MELPPVNIGDVAKHYEGTLTDMFREDFIQSKIDYTIDKAQARWGSRILQRLASGALTDRLYKATIAEAVLRVLRNPEGYTSETEGNYQYELNRMVASGYLMFTRDNIVDLIGASDTPLVGTFGVGLHGSWY